MAKEMEAKERKERRRVNGTLKEKEGGGKGSSGQGNERERH